MKTETRNQEERDVCSCYWFRCKNEVLRNLGCGFMLVGCGSFVAIFSHIRQRTYHLLNAQSKIIILLVTERKGFVIVPFGRAPTSWLGGNGLSQGKIIAKISYDTYPASTVASATGKVLVPGTESDDLSTSTTLNSNKEAASSNLRVLQETSGVKIEDNIKLEAGQTSISSELIGEESMNQGDKSSVSSQAKEEVEDVEEKPRLVPPPGTGQRIYEIDPSLKGYRGHLDYRYNQYKKMREMIDQYEGGLEAFSRGYEKFGFQR
ncbi:Carbohydrate-binding module 48 (Isoamylase N-terminal domain), partial [Musa troglodytarum]